MIATIGWRHPARAVLVGVVAIAILTAASMLATRAAPHPSESNEWALVFDETFEGSEPDDHRWTDCYWWDKGGCTNLGNAELQWYRPDNIIVRDGVLVLEAREEPTRTSEGEFAYTSGLISTGRTNAEEAREDRFAFTYGYVEVRARVPRGAGLWPAMWLLPSDHEPRPEIDIMEVLGHATNVLELHYHFSVNGLDRTLGRDRTVEDLSTGWHVFALDWSPQALVWYLDGEEEWRIVDPSIIPVEPMYLLINLAVGGRWAGPPDEYTTFPARFEIDHARIWQRVDQ